MHDVTAMMGIRLSACFSSIARIPVAVSYPSIVGIIKSIKIP